MKASKFKVPALFVGAFICLALLGAGCNSSSPTDPDDLGADEGGSMLNCAEQCTSLQAKLERLTKERNTRLIENSGCTEGSALAGNEFNGTLFGDTQWHCPNQAASEKLGEAIAKEKASPDKEIKDTERLIRNVCDDCFVKVQQCIVCAGVPRGGLCPTHFVTSVEECNALGGEISTPAE